VIDRGTYGCRHRGVLSNPRVALTNGSVGRVAAEQYPAARGEVHQSRHGVGICRCGDVEEEFVEFVRDAVRNG